MREAFFRPPDLLHKSEDLGLKVQMTFFAHGGISIKKFVMYVHIINKTLSQISSIFNFCYVKEV